jgi:hypothetical protein
MKSRDGPHAVDVVVVVSDGQHSFVDFSSVVAAKRVVATGGVEAGMVNDVVAMENDGAVVTSNEHAAVWLDEFHT